MNVGIGNVKGKGGGHPTITLSASQFSDATNLTFTQAQAEILQNNEVVNVVLPDNSTRTIYKATNDYIGAIVFSQSTQDLSSEIGGQMANVLVLCNPSTYEGMVIQAELNGTIANPTLSGNEAELTSIGIGSQAYKIGGGKQLYSHNITLIRNSDQHKYFIQIINDSANKITSISTIIDYFYAKLGTTKHYPMSGGNLYADKINLAQYIEMANDTTIRFMGLSEDSHTWSHATFDKESSFNSITDAVIAL